MLRRSVPVFITFLVGTVLIVSFFIPHRPFGSLGEEFSVFFDIISVFAFVLGGGNLLRVHTEKIGKRAAGWGYSAICVGGFTLTLVVGLFKIGNPWGIQGDLTEQGSTFFGIYEYVFKPLGATMFALLAFYVASASYRAFRAKNAEATILLVAAFIILLGRTFLGTFVTAWLPDSLSFLEVPRLANWIMSTLNLSGQRAIMIGISLGIISTSLKLILGIERSYLGADSGE
ncbi:MAG: hypothetical protein P9L99_01110 [Candidatus Lernaella stagnicola]|nr:hypothetical protein [Candidatus Lernaella stagnicola]